MANFDEWYELQDFLEGSPRIIPFPSLYNFDEDQIYGAMMRQWAQPVNGKESPFSSQAPGTFQSILAGGIAHYQSIWAHELNLTPYLALLGINRALGVERTTSEYPVIELTFNRTRNATSAGLPLNIPLNTVVKHSIDASYECYTLNDAYLASESGDRSIIVPARLNVKGNFDSFNITTSGFKIPPRLIANLESVQGAGVISSGRTAETLTETVLRAREEFNIGNRAVTARDYLNIAKRAGAKKVAVIPGRYKSEPNGYYGNLVTIAVYEPNIVGTVRTAFRSPDGTRKTAHSFQVIPAEVIRVTGRVVISTIHDITENQAFNLVANAISKRVNPPYGRWGDREFTKTLATALELEKGIYAAPIIELYEVESGRPIEELDILPWHLFSVRNTLKVEIN